MNTVVLIIQILLAVAFAVVGLGKLTQPIEKLGARMAWVQDFTPQNIRLIGALECCAAAGLVLSLLLSALPMVAALAALGLSLIMAGAMATHLHRQEYPALIANLVLLGLALLVAYSHMTTMMI